MGGARRPSDSSGARLGERAATNVPPSPRSRVQRGGTSSHEPDISWGRLDPHKQAAGRVLPIPQGALGGSGSAPGGFLQPLRPQSPRCGEWSHSGVSGPGLHGVCTADQFPPSPHRRTLPRALDGRETPGQQARPGRGYAAFKPLCYGQKLGPALLASPNTIPRARPRGHHTSHSNPIHSWATKGIGTRLSCRPHHSRLLPATGPSCRRRAGGLLNHSHTEQWATETRALAGPRNSQAAALAWAQARARG